MSRLSKEREALLRAEPSTLGRQGTAEVWAELDAVRAELDAKHAKLVEVLEVANKLRAERYAAMRDSEDANANWAKCEEENDRLEAELDAVRAERDKLEILSVEYIDLAKRYDAVRAEIRSYKDAIKINVENIRDRVAERDAMRDQRDALLNALKAFVLQYPWQMAQEIVPLRDAIQTAERGGEKT